MCTQPIQGRENATQRDKNIKHLAIWGGKVPNNDSLVIMEAQFFSTHVTSKKNVCRGNSVTVNLSMCSFGNIIYGYIILTYMKK